MNNAEAKQRTLERISDIDDLLEQGVSIADAVEQVGWSINTAYRTFVRHGRNDLRDKLYRKRNPARTDSVKLLVPGHENRRGHEPGVRLPKCSCGETGREPGGREKRLQWHRNHLRSILMDLSSDKARVLVKAAGITYRQLDHWTRKGYLQAVAKGSGTPRDWEDDAIFIASDMARLVAAGLAVEQAAVIARRHVQHPDILGRYVLGPGITLTVSS